MKWEYFDSLIGQEPTGIAMTLRNSFQPKILEL